MAVDGIYVDFISRLKERCKNSGAKSRIRHSKNPSGLLQAEGYMEMIRLSPLKKCKDICQEVSIWYTIHPMDVRDKPFAVSLVQLKKKMSSKMLDDRIIFISQQGKGRIIKEISQLISLFKHHKVSIDYATLLHDIKYLSKHYKTKHNKVSSIQRQWIEKYFEVDNYFNEKENKDETC